MDFLKNTWYMAAWAEEIGREMLARTLLSQPVLMFRKRDGTAVALSDRCAHRFAKLSDGMLIDDEVRCPYHGLKYDCTGVCTDNPHGNHIIPSKMKIRSYPLVERYGILWIWMGDAPADESLIADFTELDQPEQRRTLRRYISVKANYRLISDNLLDLSHVPFVHTAVGGATLLQNESNRSEQVGQTVWSRRKNQSIDPAPFFLSFQPAYSKVKVDKHQNMRWDVPANLLLEVTHHETGKPESLRVESYTGHLLTPETDRSTHYFWSVSRNFALDDPKLDDMMEQVVYHAFANEDGPVIEAQQRMMDMASEDLQPVLIETDVAATRARRVLEDCIAREAAAAKRPAIPIHAQK